MHERTDTNPDLFCPTHTVHAAQFNVIKRADSPGPSASAFILINKNINTEPCPRSNRRTDYLMICTHFVDPPRQLHTDRTIKRQRGLNLATWLLVWFEEDG